MAELTEQEFIKENQWYSFTSSAWWAAAGAAFFGAFGAIASDLVGLTTGNAAAAAVFTVGLMPSLALGGLIAVGLACSYMAQKESTKLRIIQD